MSAVGWEHGLKGGRDNRCVVSVPPWQPPNDRKAARLRSEGPAQLNSVLRLPHGDLLAGRQLLR